MFESLVIEIVFFFLLQASVVEGQEQGIADALFVAQQNLKDEAGESLIDDTSIEMALTDVVNGGTTTKSRAHRCQRYSPPLHVDGLSCAGACTCFV